MAAVAVASAVPLLPVILWILLRILGLLDIGNQLTFWVETWLVSAEKVRLVKMNETRNTHCIEAHEGVKMGLCFPRLGDCANKFVGPLNMFIDPLVTFIY